MNGIGIFNKKLRKKFNLKKQEKFLLAFFANAC